MPERREYYVRRPMDVVGTELFPGSGTEYGTGIGEAAENSRRCLSNKSMMPRDSEKGVTANRAVSLLPNTLRSEVVLPPPSFSAVLVVVRRLSLEPVY